MYMYLYRYVFYYSVFIVLKLVYSRIVDPD
jgi:hypothetical protein